MTTTSEKFVASHVTGLPRSGIRDFFAIVAQMPDAISLGIGEPDFVTPLHIRQAAIAALEAGRTSYTDNRGLAELRQAIQAYLERTFQVSYHPDNEILVTVGVSEAFDLALRATLNPGDKVLYHDPCYVSYHPTICLVHAVGIPVPTRAEDGFALDPDALAAAWQPGTKGVILNFPTNPTGGTVSRANLERIARFCVEKDLLVYADEIYAELTFEGEHVSIASLPGMRDRTIFLHGVSKAFAMTGFRIGFACAPAPLTEAMMKVHQYGMMCAPIVSQLAAVEALNHGDAAVREMRDSYHKRRDYIVGRCRDIGLSCHLPRAAFYAFPSVRSTGLDGREFATRLLHEQKVAVVPGRAFGPAGADHVRMSFSTSQQRITEALDRMGRFVDGLAAAKGRSPEQVRA